MRIWGVSFIILTLWGGLTLSSYAKEPIRPHQTFQFPYLPTLPQRPDIPKICSYPFMENPHNDRQTYIAPKPSLLITKIDINIRSIGLGAKDCIQHGWKLPPKFPPDFVAGSTSGYCKFSFNYSMDGWAADIKIIECTHDVLANPTVQAVKRWQWFGSECSEEDRKGQRQFSTLRYDLMDEDGEILPYP